MIQIEELKEKVLAGYQLSYEEGVELYHAKDKEALYRAADEIREHFCGNTIDLCSITNAKSGRCPQDCKWCSQSRHYATQVEEYEVVDRKEAVDQALVSASKGVKRHSLVTSGRRVYNKTLDQLIPIYKEIKEKTNLSLCASMGLIDEGQLRRLQEEVGIEHYHCNLETAPSYFPEVVSTHSIEEKIITIKTAQKLGIKVCSGGIIGMGETAEHRVELAATLAKLGVHSIPINILTPVEGTPLEGSEMLPEEDILATFAVFRFMNPKANIRFAGGRIQIKSYQHKALRAGVSAALTGDYLTTTGSKIEDDLRDFQEAGFTIDN
ncbi:biotin synthase BioB [Mangrovibacterium lignilyticum]|uniref:biotin synthase BioB n=1 Tax=Mangrovibacterium lignilyticum TaxID=2668052 RepID=UPI001966D5FD|nr:biotin synthase BioB [Mangrovibacterium lignilyticum]